MFQVFQKHHIVSENMKRIPFQFKIMQCSSNLSNSGIFVYCQMYFQCSYAKVFSSLEQFPITCMVYGRNVRSWSINNVQVANRWLGYTMLPLINYWKTVQLSNRSMLRNLVEEKYVEFTLLWYVNMNLTYIFCQRFQIWTLSFSWSTSLNCSWHCVF